MSTPVSTYRLQIRSSLTLADAAELTDYLADLGVDAVYLSPILTATSGSDHGYDTTDPTRIDPERGGEEGWRALIDGCRRQGLKVVVDIVPNHLGISAVAENPAWWDVLQHGRDSAYAAWFDLDWERAPILVPVLGDDGLDAVQLVDDEVRYHEHRFPLAPGSRREGDSVADVLGRQHYRLAHWSTGSTELNYRRFFAVTTLAGVRVEDPAVFDATHERVLRWVREDGINGLRIDHPDGLVDPGGYLQRLRDAANDVWIVAEKILEPGERLPEQWPIEGTTGYDAMTEVNQVFVDTEAEGRFTDFYRTVVGDERDLAAHVLQGKEMAATVLLPAELHRLAALVPDLPGDRVRAALVAITAHLPVYRSYLPVGRDHLDHAISEAIAADPSLEGIVADLLPVLTDPDSELCRRFQQFTGAVMAKGVEDTAYYRYTRFVALNEVGGDPARFGLSVADFHEAMADRQRRQPESMTALSTHDTKRGEDVRARMAVLTEVGELGRRWVQSFIDQSEIPDRAFASLLAQTFAGVGLIERDRMHAYAEKAMREASTGTTWTEPDDEFEATVHAAVDRAYDDENLNDALHRLLSQVQQPGWSNSLGQKLVQLTMPGVPDVYQGTELWEDSLVDPDNRRRVDFAQRRDLLRLTEPPVVDESGRAKFWVVHKALQLRHAHPELFGSYAPVMADGPAGHHLLGFDRGGAITLATRLPYALSTGHDGWGDTTITLDGRWRDVLTGAEHEGVVAVREVFHHYPVALLVRA
ncbi:malto-oligosyltrehalose synthase [Naumannella sp. ID2617S]|uniref:Malto-oligosyltrehalose synthase n=1 Tax=Enemella dayhoffiae TaxID=2016507 RepID=A0A255H0H7_9ACTN|nr:malto-oligosyltrehalose synthase [Enemella dayhoffiae]NNG18081.1 malto-oligosyltrehalose synthase [Naumannella sp. ID2617S]OYO21255.1 malto-oligosyltrehalose synthase [Enemella dayhoffiae]